MRKSVAATVLLLMTSLAVIVPVHGAEGRLCASLAVNIRDQFSNMLSSRPPFLPTVQKVLREQPFQLYLLLSAPAVKEGKADVSARITMRSPDGSIKELTGELPALRGKLSPGGKVYLAGLTVKQIFTGSDRSGIYRFSGTVTDRQDKSTFTLPEITVELADTPDTAPAADKYFKKISDLGNFITFYYRDPQPGKILPALEFYFRNGEAIRRNNRSNTALPILAGFTELMMLNPQLWVPLARMSAGLNTRQRHEMATIINAVGAVMEEKCRPYLDQETLALLGSRSGNNPLLFRSVSLPVHLDILWAKFFVTGASAPLRLIAAQLGRRNIVIPAEAATKGRNLSNEEREGLKNYLLLSAADWSLTSNAFQHQLAANYLERMLAGRQISDHTSRILIQRALIQAERRRSAIRKNRIVRSLKTKQQSSNNK